jgi:hypothetical protein
LRVWRVGHSTRIVTPTEIVAIKRALEPKLKAEAREREHSGKGANESGGRGRKKTLGEFPPGFSGRAADKLGAFVPLDAIPHWDYPIRSASFDPKIGAPMRYDRALSAAAITIGADGILGVALSLALSATQESFVLPPRRGARCLQPKVEAAKVAPLCSSPLIQSFEPIYERHHLTRIFQKISNQYDRGCDQEPVLHEGFPRKLPLLSAAYTLKLSLFGFLKKCALIKRIGYLK